MTDDREIELQALITERAAMEAENIERNYQGYAIAWNYEAFMELAERIRALKEKE